MSRVTKEKSHAPVSQRGRSVCMTQVCGAWTALPRRDEAVGKCSCSEDPPSLEIPKPT